MPDSARTPRVNFLLSPPMIDILNALADGEKHAFAITLAIEAFTNGEVITGPGTLFSSLERLLEAGLVEQSDERIDPNLDDQSRRFYRMTGLGQRSLQKELKQRSSQGVVTQAKDLLGSSIKGSG